ncbi:butyrophilin subfamily 3 member A3-like [Xyrichtys novacula]|uniref:Butyrophilin subfamily 3 member A3-like n=1 Tax=Xyrichtys novacula TaxID=13765 RepID=A0AAV1G8V4_XYRNO|nr:butyrophilin subfamily 3 member A3-like [Xyrichtys novacula]
MNTFDMTVEWSRPDLDPRFVFVWRDGVELGSNKHPSFRGRSSVFIDKLRHGNVSMKLSEVKLSDEGGYRCFIPTLSKDVTVQLVVGAVSSPVLRLTRNNSGVLLECESKGWYPEPEMFLLDAEGNLLSSSPTETIRGPDDLYTVSRKVTVEEKHGKNFSCRVTQKKIHQSRETHTVIPDHFFMVPTTPSTPIVPSPPGFPGSSGSQPVLIGSVIVCAALVLIPLVVFILWRRRKNKLKNKKDHENGTEQTEEGKTKTSKGDLTEFNVEKEGEEERVALMNGGENIIKYQEEIKKHPEQSTIKIKTVFKNRQEDEFRGDLQTDINETLMETKEKLNQTKEDRGKQAEQQLEVKEKDREKTEESTEEVKVMDEEMMKTEEDNINVTQKKDEGVQNQNERRRRREEAVRRAAERRGTRQQKSVDREIREEGKEEEGGGGRTEESETEEDL